jgi:metal-sulfur cluster biosynthetic enzyme
MTMTSPACPVSGMLIEQACAAVEAIAPAGTPVRVNLVWDPIWNPSMMSGVAREFFGWER